MTRTTPFRGSLVIRWPHPNAEPVIEGFHWTASPAFTAAAKLAASYPGQKVTVMQDGYESEVKP